MIAWNLINFILILALSGIVIFLLIKRKKESYTPTAQMNQNIRNNANVIETIVGTIDTLIGKKGLVIINKENIAKINKELNPLIGKGGQIAANRTLILSLNDVVATNRIQLNAGDLGYNWFIRPDKNTLSFCYSYPDKFSVTGLPRKVVTVAIMKFIPQKPEKPGPGTPGVRGVIGNFLSQRAYMPTGGCVPDPKDYSSSNPHVPSSTTVYGPPA